MTGAGRQCLSWLRAYDVDLVVAAMDVEPADLEFSPILSSDYVVITPEDHPLAGRTSVTLRELSPHPLVLHTAGTYTRQFVELYMRQHGHSRRVAVEVDGWSAIRDCVEAGLGIAVVPELCLSERDRVWRIPIDDPVRHGYTGRLHAATAVCRHRYDNSFESWRRRSRSRPERGRLTKSYPSQTDRLKQLRMFYYAATLESITRTAEHIGVAQPTVSTQVRELENELGAALFDRSAGASP